ncbi:MAG: TonB-dependent receptor family protein [Bdellovibrionales bacterium]
MSKNLILAGGLAVAALLAAPAWAEEATPTMPTITIHARNEGTLTVPAVAEQKEQLFETVGAVSFVDSESYQDTYANTVRDVLKDTPGVYVQNRYGQEMRLSIRGSGMARGFHARGIEILQDGIPNNLADGSGDYYQIDPLALRSTEVYKGGNALSYGGSTLGGAVNFVTPTAAMALAPNSLRMESGSFGTLRGNGQFSRTLGDADFLANGTVTHADGYREHSTTQTEAFNANAGYRFSPVAETRFYVGAFVVDQKLPGALSLNDALHNPTMASSAAISDDQARDTRTERMANRTSFKLDFGKLDLDTWAIHKSLFHPIFQVIDQDGWTLGIAPRYTSDFHLGGRRNELIAGGRVFGGNNTAMQYQNLNGSRGLKTLDARQDAYNFEIYGENRYWFMDDVAFMAGAKAFLDQRNYTDKGGLSTNPTPKYASKDYSGINPKAGFLWQPEKDVQAFIDVTRSQDVPDFSDLTQTTATTTQFVPLKTQDAWTLEIGSRGKSGRYGWDVTAYRSWIEHELMQYTTNASIPATTFNAGDTLHQGLEVGGSAEVWHGLFEPEAGDTVTLTQIWNYNDFHFQNDPQYGNNRIAGVPEHVLRTELAYRHKTGFYFTPTVDWVPDGAWADQANTLKAPGYVLLGLQTGVQLDNGILFYIDARNLTGESYVSDISTITDARTAGTNIFYPGDGRSIFAGIRYAF